MNKVLNKDVPKLYAPSFSVPKMYAPTLQVPKLEVPWVTNTPSPNRRTVRDLGDVLLGTKYGTRQLRDTLITQKKYEYLEDPLMARLYGLHYLMKERQLDPILEGNVGEAFVNGLETLGGSLDILANPVKSLMPWAGGGEEGDFLRSMGWLEGEYRELYQWDTGNWAVDFIGEVVSDPINWFTFGSSAIAKTATSAVDDVVLDASKIFIKEAVDEDTAITMAKTFLNQSDDDFVKAMDNYLDARKVQMDELQTQLSKANKYSTQQKYLSDIKSIQKETDEISGFLAKTTSETRSKITQNLSDLRQNKYLKAYNKMGSWRKVNLIANSIDDTLLKASLAISPFGLPQIVAQSLLIRGFKHIYNKVIYGLKNIDLDARLDRKEAKVKTLKKDITTATNTMYADTYNDWQSFLAKNNYSAYRAHKLWMSCYSSIPDAAKNLDVVNKKFIDALFKQVPILKRWADDSNLVKLLAEEARLYKGEGRSLVYKDKDITFDAELSTPAKMTREQAIAEGYNVNTDYEEYDTEALPKRNNADKDLIFETEGIQLSLEDFIDYNTVLGVSTATIDLKMIRDTRDLLNNRIKDFWAARKKDPRIIAEKIPLKELSAEEILTYLDKEFIPGGLSNYNKYMLELRINDPQVYEVMLQIFNMIGVTQSNINHVLTYLNYIKKNPKSGLWYSLEDVLRRSRTDVLLDASDTTLINKEYNRLKQIVANTEDPVTRALMNTRIDKVDFEPVVNKEQHIETIKENITDISVNDFISNIDVVTLDTVFNYPGSDSPSVTLESFVETLSNLKKSFNKVLEPKATTEVKAQFEIDFDNFLLELEDLNTRVKYWENTLLSDRIQGIDETTLSIARGQVDFIKSTIEELNQQPIAHIPVADLKTAITDAVKNQTDIMILKNTQQGQENLVINIMDMLENIDPVWKEIADPNSNFRAQLKDAYRLIEDSIDAKSYITDIKEICSTVDVVHLFYQTFDRVYSSYDLEESLARYIRNEMFNRIYHARNELITDELKQRIMEQFEQNLRHTSNIKSIAAISPDVDINSVLNEIINNASKYYDEYVNGLEIIKTNNDLAHISLFKDFSTNNIAGRMNGLGFGYKHIMEALLDPRYTRTTTVAYEPVVTMSRFITRASDKVFGSEVNDIKRLIENRMFQTAETRNKSSWNITSRLQALYNRTSREQPLSLANELYRQYANVGRSNKYLRGVNPDDPILGKVWTDDFGFRPIENVMGYVYASDVEKIIRDLTRYNNTYDFSTDSGLAFKTMFHHAFIENAKLTPEYFVDNLSNIEYNKFLTHAEQANIMINKRAITADSAWIESLRKTLTETYTSLFTRYPNLAIWYPKDIANYFASLDDRSILIWDHVSGKKHLNSVVAKNYNLRKTNIKHQNKLQKTFAINKQYEGLRFQLGLLDANIQGKLDRHLNPFDNTTTVLDIINMYENKPDVFSPEYHSVILDQTNFQDLDIQVDKIKQDLARPIKDINTLGAFKQEYTEYIKHDGEAVDRIRFVQDLITDTRKAPKKIQEYCKELTKSDRTFYNNDKEVMSIPKTERNRALFNTLNSFNAKQLRAWIDQGPGILFINNFRDMDIDWLNKFNSIELKEAGLKIYKDPYVERGYIIRRTDLNKTKADYDYVMTKSLLPKLQQQFTDMFRANRTYYDFDGIDLPSELYSGDIITEHDWNRIVHSDKYKDIFGDLTEQKLYSNLDEIGNNTFFKKNEARPDIMFVGSNSYNEFMGNVATPFQGEGETFRLRRNTLALSSVTGLIQAVNQRNAEHKLLSLIHNDDFHIDNPMFRHALESASDQELKDFFQRNNFVACIVKQNKAGEPKIYRVHIYNKKSLALAIENHAMVLPYEIYRTSVLGVNQHKVASKFFNIYTKWIAGTYKHIWLGTLGFPMRNFLDSAIYKNLNTVDGFADAAKVFKNEYKAAKWLDKYDDMYKEIIQRRKVAEGFATPNMYYIKEVLREHSIEDQQMFVLMFAFEQSGGAAGLTETVEKALLNFNKAMATGSDVIDDSLIDLVFKASPTSWINKVNDRTERIARLGLLITLLDEGLSKGDAFKRVIDTHFDYQLMESELGLLGQVFWFLTFPIQNSLYYLNEGLTKNPEMLKMYMDAMEQSWNSGDITWEDVKESSYLTYNAMAGNIRFEFNGKNIVLKTGSSVMDFFQILVDPIGSATERLNPFFSVLFGLDEPSQLNPLASVSNRIDQIKDGRSLLPSVYTTLYDRKKRPRYYIEKAPYVYGQSKSSWYFKPRKTYFKKPDNMKRMRYKFSTDRFYYNRSKTLNRYMTAVNSIDPAWFMNNYRYIRNRKRFNRQVM